MSTDGWLVVAAALAVGCGLGAGWMYRLVNQAMDEVELERRKADPDDPRKWGY